MSSLRIASFLALVIVVAHASATRAFCAQNHDVIVLKDGNKTIEHSEMVLLDAGHVVAFCIEGRCFLRPDRTSHALTLVRVPAGPALDATKEELSAKGREVLQGNSGLKATDDTYRYYLGERLLMNAGLIDAVSESVRSLKGVPLKGFERVRNRFTGEDCSYQRVFTVEASTGKLTSSRD
jgi:hypothetical protein